MNFFALKKEQFYFRSALRQGIGINYLRARLAARRIFAARKIFQRPVNRPDLSIHVLTCHQDLTMLAWSLASYYLVAKAIGQLYVHSDGTLNKHDEEKLRLLFPEARLINPWDIEPRLEKELVDYPALKKFRLNFSRFVLLKKLIDPYFASPANLHLIIDSDLIWFQNPHELEQAIQQGERRSFMMLNNGECPVYFKKSDIYPSQLARYNSGVVLYRRDNFNLKKLSEYMEKIDEENPQNPHFIEQAGYAYCLENLAELPQIRYHIKGAVSAQTAVKHYTSPRRVQFYTEGLARLESKILHKR